MRRGSAAYLLWVALLVLGGATPAWAQTQAAEPSDSLVEAIVYTTLRPPNWDIYLFEESGDAPRRLTDHPALEYNAAFSPDGRWIVFTSERSGNTDLYALEVDREGPPFRLTRHEGLDDAAAFSPDGRRLAFVSTREGNADIFVMPFAPGDPKAEESATNLTRRPGGDFNPAFSPDGRSIAYSRQGKLWSSFTPDNPVFDISVVDLYLMDADGSNPRQLSQRGPGPEIEPGVAYGSVSGSPAWSEDGELLYYYRVDAEGIGIRRVRPDGSGDTPVAPEGLSPTLAPDGRIAFSRPQPREGLDAGDVLRTGRIFSVAADGSGVRQETDTLRSYFAPDFDLGSGRMVAHGPGPTEAQVGSLRDGVLFAPPGARARARLPDRTLPVWGVRGAFPALTPAGNVFSTVFQLPGPTGMPLRISSLDGAELRELFSPEGGVAWGPAVAGDAGSIVVAVGPPFAPGEVEVDIWKLALDGSNAVNLTADVPGNHALPDISADGKRIAFRSGGDGGGRVYVMDGDGGGRRRLTDEEAIETMPALSPDGEWIVFPTDRAEGRKLWIQRVDGSEGRYLEPGRLEIPDTSMHPRFSPDGEWVVFTSNRGGYNDEWPLTPWPQPYGDLWAVPVAGGSAVRLFHNKWEDGPSDWGRVRPGRLPEPSLDYGILLDSLYLAGSLQSRRSPD